jgi:hypothetical protein
MSENEWTKILGWPGYRIYRSEINEEAKDSATVGAPQAGNRGREVFRTGKEKSRLTMSGLRLWTKSAGPPNNSAVNKAQITI